MRLAILADIHGNLPALEAVLADMTRLGVEDTVCLGDVAAFGPQPRQVLRRVRDLGCAIVMGNADDELLHPETLKTPGSGRIDPVVLYEIASWGAEQLSEHDFQTIRGFQKTVGLELGGLSLLCFHGSPRSFDDVITATTPDAELGALLAGHAEKVMAGGHTHTQLLRRYEDIVLVNPGSVGLPFESPRGGGEARNPPWAEYALLELAGSDLSFSFRRVAYDVTPLIEAAWASGMPHTEGWLKGWLPA